VTTSHATMNQLGRTALPVVAEKPAIDYELLLDCVHCGLCTSACPTYVETGHEADSPRGRIHLMRSVVDGRLELDDPTVAAHLDLCLNCRACESACPSGVQYGKIIEPFRLLQAKHDPRRAQAAMPLLQRLVVFNVFHSARLSRWALGPARLMQRLHLDTFAEKTGLLRLLPASLRQMHAMLPRLAPHYGRLPEVLPAEGPRRARVGLFLGCVADAVYPQTNLATARVLQKNGVEVWIPRQQQCCGALHYHAQMEQQARAFGQANCAAFGLRDEQPPPLDAIITNAAGCGAMLKDYGHLLQHSDDAHAGQRFAAAVRDISEFLVQLGPTPPTHPLPVRATYHDACHLCHAQQIRKPPRQLLEMIPGLELVPLAESELCCGAAGSYNLTHPEMAERLGERKVRNILATGAKAVLTGNVGCLLQINRHLRRHAPEMTVAHPVDALYASYTGTPL
jgi:glycolate oxidase iron-sulfur subunit